MELLILNTEFEAIAVIDEYESLIWTDRYDSYGDFEIIFAMNTDLLKVFKEDYYIQLKESEHCMIIENIAIDSDVENGNRLTVTGRSLESILERRIIWSQTKYSGNLQLVIKSILDKNIMSPSISNRKISNFIFTASEDTKVKELTMRRQYTGDNLYSVIQNLCAENGIGFKIILNDNNQFEFSLYAGSDRSYGQTKNPYVVFSPNFENIINSNYFSSKAGLKTVTLVAGEGEGASRKTVTMSKGASSGLDRREIFTDAREISSDINDDDTAEVKKQKNAEYRELLIAKGNKTFAENNRVTAFEGEVEATRLFKYGKDFFIGDIVQIANEYGSEGEVYISELVISKSKDEQTIYPTFKTYDKQTTAVENDN